MVDGVAENDTADTTCLIVSTSITLHSVGLVGKSM